MAFRFYRYEVTALWRDGSVGHRCVIEAPTASVALGYAALLRAPMAYAEHMRTVVCRRIS